MPIPRLVFAVPACLSYFNGQISLPLTPNSNLKVMLSGSTVNKKTMSKINKELLRPSSASWGSQSGMVSWERFRTPYPWPQPKPCTDVPLTPQKHFNYGAFHCGAGAVAHFFLFPKYVISTACGGANPPANKGWASPDQSANPSKSGVQRVSRRQISATYLPTEAIVPYEINYTAT